MTTSTTYYVDAPMAGTDLEHLLASLERLRATFRWKADGLDADGLTSTVGASSLTIGGLLKHLARVEQVKFTWDAFGHDPGEPWRSVDWDADPDWDFTSAAGDSPEELYSLYDDVVARTRERLLEAISRDGVDQLTELGQEGRQASLRRLLHDLLEEYGRHTGHADLLREAVDGRVGEDPPPGWQPGSPG